MAALAAPAAAAPRVVVTIKPLHSLAAGVMEGVAEPHLLLPGTTSPHMFALKPSDTRTLSQADLVIWVGPALETVLSRPLESLAQGASVLAATSAAGVHLLPARTDAAFAADHAHGSDGHLHGSDGDGKTAPHDMHLWLDPANAKAIVTAITDRLAALDPTNGPAYRANSMRVIAGLERLSSELAAKLAPVRGRPFLVMHDAYQYLEARFGLSSVGAVAIDPSRQPGSRHVARLRKRIVSAGVECIFTEPQFAPRLAETLTQGSKVRRGLLDPIGASIAPGPGHYTGMMHANADAIVDCLTPRP